jgi:c-di-AMP phosphodiesterase-like protein
MNTKTDIWAYVIIALTFIFFAISIFITGFKHDLLLEIGVLLVSIKLIMMASTNKKHNEKLHQEMGELKSLIKDLKEQKK